MTKKQYRTPNESVATVKKSIAAMASRWFLRNVSHRFAESGSLGGRRIRGRYSGRRVVRMETILNSWEIGFPTALNQTAGPVVSKRIKLNEALALSCLKLPVSLIFMGSIWRAIHVHISRSHPGLAYGPSLRLSSSWERVLRALQILQDCSGSRK